MHVGWRARFLGERPKLAAPLESDFFYSFLAGKKKGAQLMLKIRLERTLFTKKILLVQCISVYVCVWNLSATLPLTFFASRHSVIFLQILFHQNILQKLTQNR